MATSNCLVTLQNIFFCVQQKKETQTGLEQHEVEKMMTEFFHVWANDLFRCYVQLLKKEQTHSQIFIHLEIELHWLS